MDPTPAEPPPGCLVLLLSLSAEMTASVVTGRGTAAASAVGRQLAAEVLEGLVRAVAAGHAVGPIDVAVLGYRTPKDGMLQLISLLPGGDPKPQFTPLARIAEQAALERGPENQPREWVGLPACEGESCAPAALARVYQLVSVWLTGRFTARAPVVVHCTTAGALDDVYIRVARSLQLLATAHGQPRVLHYVFDPEPESEVVERLAEVSVELPRKERAVKITRRAVFVNDWDVRDPLGALFAYSPQEDTVAWAWAGAGLSAAATMWTQKMGNAPDQWEDAFALDEATSVAAVADGASAGIYCSIWAQQLSQRFLTDRPDARDPAALDRWVNGLRAEWRTAINYSNLNWSKQAKVDQVGAAATLLGLELGPADARGRRPWRACAVGDASLFWVRANRLRATFPVVAADQFGSAPLLIRSNPGFRTLSLAAAGTCEPGDRFVLATDAVAARLFRSLVTGYDLDWGRFEALDEAEWCAEMDALRKANDMVNDDCTLVVLRVSAPAGGVAALNSGAGEEPEELPFADGEPLVEDVQASEPTGRVGARPRTGAPFLPEGELLAADIADADDWVVEEPSDLLEPGPEELPPHDNSQVARDDLPKPTDPGVGP
ncbi:hypothetical protein J8F10_27520 [Gemmata sp. G18]|uniref:VWFA domain-containing protein n=1 Tax=Gemmata palustris TaxID=2822762 RepID=A0ABS5BZD5_9BACT|nr:hypothetical protein [Gemmata palustris]MBP3959010.1 hypothetical protein [Gemmata palustris]